MISRIWILLRALWGVLIIFGIPTCWAAPCTLIHIARYFDGSQEVKASTYLLILKNRISKISPTPPPRSSDCLQVDLTHTIMTPGLIDSHSHLFLTDSSYSDHFSTELLRQGSIPNRITQAKKFARQLLLSGFTTLRDLGNSGRFQDVALSKQVEQGKVVGPRIFVSGPGLAVKEGEFPVGTSVQLVQQEYEILDSIDRVDSTLRLFKKRGVHLIKVYADNDPNPAVMPQALLQAIVQSAHALGLRVAAHAIFDSSALAATRAGVDTIEHGESLSEATLQIMRLNGTILIPTDLGTEECQVVGRHSQNALYRSCEQYHELRARRIRLALKLGVPIAFGSDSYLSGSDLPDRGKLTLGRLMAYTKEGLSPLQTLQAATRNAALALGQTDLGVIREGAIADLVGYAGNPMEHISDLKRILFVMKDGQIFLR